MDGGQRCGPHRFLKRVFGIQQSRRIEDDHLRNVGGSDPDYAIARRLGLWARDAKLLADDAIEQRRFSDIRFSDDGYDPRFWHQYKITPDFPLKAADCGLDAADCVTNGTAHRRLTAGRITYYGLTAER